MINKIKNMILAFKTAFMMGRAIGQEGKQKEFIKHPIRTIQEVKTNEPRKNKDNQDRKRKA